MNWRPTPSEPAKVYTFTVVVGTLGEGVTTALPPTHEEIERLLAAAPRNGIEIKLLGH